MISKKVLFLSVLVIVVKSSVQTPVAPATREDINLDLTCVSNATCLSAVSNRAIKALKLKKALNFGIFTVEPLKNAKTEGRSFTKFWDIASSNAVRVPFGSYSVNVQKSEEHENYLEIALMKTVGEGKV